MTRPEAGDRELSHSLAKRVRLFETLVRRLRPQELVIAIDGSGARVPMHSMSLPHRPRGETREVILSSRRLTYDRGHGFQDTDSGSSTSWVPSTVWAFLMPLLF